MKHKNIMGQRMQNYNVNFDTNTHVLQVKQILIYA